MIFTTSWDDGHPDDLRVADILGRYGFRGTFYIPIRNMEGRRVLSVQQKRSLTRFEVGSHTLDHCYLRSVTRREAARQIAEGKSRLEDQIGQAVAGFCYPGGDYSSSHRGMVEKSGFEYARTVANLHLDAGTDRFAMTTTLQLYPHKHAVYLRNFLRHGRYVSRVSALRIALAHQRIFDTLVQTLNLCIARDGVFHLWGHSWELNTFGGWSILEDFLDYANSVVPHDARLSNRDTSRVAFAEGARVTETIAEVSEAT